MHGYKTIITALIMCLMGIATHYNVGIPAETWQQLGNSLTAVVGNVLTLCSIVMVVLRAVTKTPMLKGRLPAFLLKFAGK